MSLHPMPQIQPLADNFIQLKLVTRLDKHFNQLWYHLYRAVTETRELRLGSAPDEKEETLAEYARKTLDLWKTQKGLEAELEETGLKNIEAEVKKIDAELNKVLFLDERGGKVQKGKEGYAGTSKYKQIVMEELGIKEDNERNYTDPASYIDTTKPKASRRESVQMLMQKRKQPQKRMTMVAPVLHHFNEYAAEKKSPFLTEVKEKSKSKNRLFEEDPIGPLARYMTIQDTPYNRNKAKEDKRKNTPNAVVDTPFTKHAESVLRVKLTPEMIQKTIERDEAKRQAIMKIATQIYGKKRRACSMLDAGSPVKDSKNKEKERFVSPVKPLSTRGFARTFSAVRTANSRNTRTTNLCRANSALLLGTRLKKCSTSGGERRRERLNNILVNCLEEQLFNNDALTDVHKFKRDVKTELKDMAATLSGAEERKKKVEEKRHAINITRKKHLFIYGKNGLGRFLTEDAKDVVKMSDLMMNLNPKYPFMLNRFGDILVKDP